MADLTTYQKQSTFKQVFKDFLGENAMVIKLNMKKM